VADIQHFSNAEVSALLECLTDGPIYGEERNRAIGGLKEACKSRLKTLPSGVLVAEEEV
jgi:hypothetical protein